MNAAATPPVSLILRTTSRVLVPLMLLFSIFVLLRGHQQPGGGFGASLVAVAAFGLYVFSRGWASAQRALRWPADTIAVSGLTAMAGSAALGPLAGRAPLEALWFRVHLAGLPPLEVGTPLLFDVGVYLAVMGSMLTVIFGLVRRARVMPE